MANENKFDFVGRCGCGREVRYQLSGKGSCNKYMRCPSYEDLEARAKELRNVIMFGLGLIKLSEQFAINLGKGWMDFKEKAKAIGIIYKSEEELQAEMQESFKQKEKAG